MIKQNNIPPYIKNISSWLYLNHKVYNFFDNPLLLNIITLGAHSKLIKELKTEISPKANILQIGITLGNQIDKTYETLDKQSTYTVIDVLPKIIKRCQEKYVYNRIHFIEKNATTPLKESYDIIICYMLLHELPPKTKAKILSNIINALAPNGKAIFIDYNLPSSFNPLKYFIRAINRLYQPFAESLWKNSIKNMTPNAEHCTWTKQTYYGGMYQKVVATKK